MKLLQIGLILAGIATFGNAATVTVSQGFGSQGFTVTTDGTALLPTFLVAVGGYSGGIFTPFGAVTDTAKANGVITSSAPTSLNSQVINLFIGNGSTVANSSHWIILTPTSPLLFPPDVTAATGVTYAATVGTGQTLVATSGPSATWSPTTTAGGLAGSGNINFVPEPSAAILSAIGILGFLRRRRN